MFLPGEASLLGSKYYANPRNHFWPILFAIFEERPQIDYDVRIGFLASKKIGLWDELASCERKGSLDSAIRKGAVNDFDRLEAGFRFPQILDYLPKPSTSPANAISFVEKLAKWRELRNLV